MSCFVSAGRTLAHIVPPQNVSPTRRAGTRRWHLSPRLAHDQCVLPARIRLSLIESRNLDSQSITSLLNRAGFALSTVDVDEIEISYPSIFELVEDLKWMGEGNAVVNRCVAFLRDEVAMLTDAFRSRPHLRMDTLMAAASIYKGSPFLYYLAILSEDRKSVV